MNKKICVIGGGNIGTYVAVYAKRKEYEVALYVGDETKFAKTLFAENIDDGETYSAEIDCVTSSLKLAMKDADIVFITYPAFLFEGLGKEMLQYIDGRTVLCFLPGTGGVEFAFSECIKKGAVIFGLQRVPLVARLKEYGKVVSVNGKRDCLYLGGIGAEKDEIVRFSEFLKNLFETDCGILPNYLCVTLTPSNPILHTSRLFSMFKEYRHGKVYDRNFLFYEEWGDEASDILFLCDGELQDICREMEISSGYKIDLSKVTSLKKHYESETPEQLTQKMQSIRSLKGLSSPMKRTERGWIPDFSSRYFSADFPYGLKILIDIGRVFDVPTPSMDSIWEWFCRVCPKRANEFCSIGLSKDEFLALYKVS